MYRGGQNGRERQRERKRKRKKCNFSILRSHFDSSSIYATLLHMYLSDVICTISENVITRSRDNQVLHRHCFMKCIVKPKVRGGEGNARVPLVGSYINVYKDESVTRHGECPKTSAEISVTVSPRSEQLLVSASLRYPRYLGLVYKRRLDTLLGGMPIVVARCHHVHLVCPDRRPQRQIVQVHVYRKIRIVTGGGQVVVIVRR